MKRVLLVKSAQKVVRIRLPHKPGILTDFKLLVQPCPFEFLDFELPQGCSNHFTRGSIPPRSDLFLYEGFEMVSEQYGCVFSHGPAYQGLVCWSTSGHVYIPEFVAKTAR
jgi:hypothetical protein